MLQIMQKATVLNDVLKLPQPKAGMAVLDLYVYIFAGSLESANSFILVFADTLFKILAGKKSGFYDN